MQKNIENESLKSLKWIEGVILGKKTAHVLTISQTGNTHL